MSMSDACGQIRVLLVCLHALLCDGLARLLAEEPSLALIGTVNLSEALLLLQTRPAELEIEAVILAGDLPDEASRTMFGNLLASISNIPVIQVCVNAHSLRVYVVREALATSEALLNALRRLASSANSLP